MAEGTDPLLAALITVVERTDIEVGMTFFLPGGPVTGDVISTKAYMADYAKYAGLEHAEFADVTPSEEDPPPLFVHMRNAQIPLGAGLAPTEGGFLWRGTLSSIVGFAHGSMRASRH